MKQIALISTSRSGQPFGLVALASWVNSRKIGWTASVIDAAREDPVAAAGEGFDVIGISAMSATYEYAIRIAKQARPSRAPVILGGVHISTCPESIHPVFDRVFCGEGERTLVSWLCGCSFTNSHVDLWEYPDIDFSLFHADCWKPKMQRHWRGVVVEGSLVTSRGCPYNCRFCSTSSFWKSYRTHTPEWTVRQMQAMAERGVNRIAVWDDLFAVNKHRLRRIAELFESAGLQRTILGMSVNARADCIDGETCDILRSMNVSFVGFGLESGSERVLRYLKKGRASVKANDDALATVNKHGMMAGGSVMLGNPTETFREMLMTVAWVALCVLRGVDDIIPFVATPYPGTKFWTIAKAKGRVGERMNFDLLAQRSRAIGEAHMLDIPRWQFAIAWWLLQIVLIPIRAKKLIQMTLSKMTLCNT